jgi:hypothetical protein
MLGIARRKAGTTVKCPRCSAEVRVPALAGMAVETNGPVGAAPAIPKSPPGLPVAPRTVPLNQPRPVEKKLDSMPLFERPDFESLLNPAVENAKPNAEPAAEEKQPYEPPRRAKRRERDEIEEAIDVEELTNTIVLTRTKLTVAAAVVAVLLGVAFAAGYVLASTMLTKEKGSSANPVENVPGRGGKYLEG